MRYNRFALIVFIVIVFSVSSTVVFSEIQRGEGSVQRGNITNNLVSSYACSSLLRCKEIDLVWGSRIGISFNGGKVWDSTNNKWINFNEAYPSSVSSNLTGSNPNPTSSTNDNKPVYDIPAINVPDYLLPCVKEVQKLAQAAEEMTSWEECDVKVVTDVCNPSSSNTCCGMAHSGCCYGVPNSPCPGGCCGTYVWQVFNLAINKYGLHVSWPLGEKNGKYSWDPGDIVSEKQVFTLNQWSDPNMQFDKGNFKPADIIPGDIIYFRFPKGHKNKCLVEGSSHINIVGPPTADGKKYTIIDVACKKDGVCEWSVWHYPNFFYEKEYCKDQGTDSLLAGEAWQYVYRVIPECMNLKSE
jgi:hypothetical protein